MSRLPRLVFYPRSCPLSSHLSNQLLPYLILHLLSPFRLQPHNSYCPFTGNGPSYQVLALLLFPQHPPHPNTPLSTLPAVAPYQLGCCNPRKKETAPASYYPVALYHIIPLTSYCHPYPTLPPVQYCPYCQLLYLPNPVNKTLKPSVVPACYLLAAIVHMPADHIAAGLRPGMTCRSSRQDYRGMVGEKESGV